MAARRRSCSIKFLVLICVFVGSCCGESSDIERDVLASNTHRIDSLNLLLYTFLLILTVLTVWLFKHRRLRFLHETGLAVIYGLIIGAIIRYAGGDVGRQLVHEMVVPEKGSTYNESLPPDFLLMRFPTKTITGNKTYSYTFRGEIKDIEENEIDLKATFDPEIFFNIILPPIIFHAGYSLKRRYFFRNLGAILTYAMLGTTISSFVIGAVMYGAVQLMPNSSSFTFLDLLYFGSIISATDPVTVLAIFNDLHVDVNLYALVFGESVLNDAVAMVLSGAIQNYSKHSGSGSFEFEAFLKAVGNFFSFFSLSLFLGAGMGCLTALLTKFTRVRDFPLLESALFLLMSYSTFLMAEATELTGIVAVLFCGMCQAHYTYNNLSIDSRRRTKKLFELLNFLAENFIFCYIGVSMFTFPKHHFDVGFIVAAFFCAALGRAANIYPLSFLLNLGRKPKISYNFQHMLFFSGLRGAMAFALAIRNTVSEARQSMLTATSLVVIVTVIVLGGSTMQLLTCFNIPVGVEEEVEMLQYGGVRSALGQSAESGRRASSATGSNNLEGTKPNEKAWMARIWADFDVRYMKPFLTHARPTLLDTLPVCCNPIARILTTTEQLTQEPRTTRHRNDSDSDMCLDDSEMGYGTNGGAEQRQPRQGVSSVATSDSWPQAVRVKLPGPRGAEI
ncbi:sodium/hydrogen exchanger 6 isoform X3 [Neocloeon triangulifer]|uniref:sodium/hydrogen exchanger 6 isoform X3 n=1 Tax=Neocloeon triangulifer TaxID=2078957 RepID=UPI00286F47D6|nr:sodium/hydrogen exchanger 6 isoform X3 [Neocloeon triangulifer]